MVRVLFVCTGNVCRSPMAEGLLRTLLRQQDHHDRIIVESAGTFPMEGAPASSEAVSVAAEHGVDLRGHAARALGARLVARSDLILVMEPEHRERLLEAFPEAGRKTHLVTTFSDPDGEQWGIPDPMGRGRAVYEETFRRIEGSLRAALPKVMDLLEGESGSGSEADQGNDGSKGRG